MAEAPKNTARDGARDTTGRHRLPDTAGAELADSLLLTKLSPPQAPLAQIDRDALLARLEKGRRGGLTLVVAAAGYGKTTLLAQWRARLQAEGAVVGWVTLDENDAEPGQLLSFSASALSAGGAALGQVEMAAAKGFADVPPRAALAALLAALARETRDVVLMLDDYHRVQSPELDRLLDALLAHRPPCLHLVIASRTRPDIAIASLRAQGQAQEIGAAALRFSAAEARALFSPSLTDADLSRLTERTEGWVVALQLARLWLNEAPAAAEALDRFSGRTKEMAEYLAEQVLANLPVQTRRFLTETAPLEQFNWELANAVCGRQDSAALLDQLSRLTSLLVPLDSERQWYRYHHLFGDYLADLLRRADPERLSAVCATASRWHEERGSLVEAVRYARLAGDDERAARLMEDAGGWEMILLGGISRMRTLLNFLPAATLRAHPRLQVARVYLMVKDGEVAAASALMEETRAMLRTGGKPDAALERDMLLMGSLLDVYQDRLEVWPSLAALDAQARALPASDHMAFAVLYSMRAVLALNLGDLHEVRSSAVDAIRYMRAVGSVLGRNYCLLHLGQAQELGGKLREAVATYREALATAEDNFGSDSGLKALSDVLLASALYAHGDLEGAERHLLASLAHVESYDGWYDVYASAYRTLVRLAMARGDAVAARDAIARGERTAIARGLPRLTATLRPLSVQVALAAGQEPEPRLLAQLEAQWSGRTPGSANWREELPARIALALAHLRAGRPAEAQASLGDLAQRCRAAGRDAHGLEVELVAMVARQAAGDAEGAARDLLQVLGPAIAEGNRRVFLDLGQWLVPVLQRAMRLSRDELLGSLTSEFLGGLLDELRLAEGRSHSGAPPLFSRREHEVLVELAHGLSNKEIARALNLTENTVKFHLKSIFAKLEVDRRSQAIAVAQARRLI